ncbi:hypothetical protein MNV49_004418 [Pseudohyphozyma bogoriensis]|nr:hypothetical protein MNV49_004418 [Pseudohyphozyma bogoriensis]
MPRQNTPWGESPLLPTGTINLNGTTEQKLDRLAIRELCEGWPTHRDAQEWEPFRALFTNSAYVFTTWSDGCSIDEFIRVSKKGFYDGERIMHQCLGCTVETNAAGTRGIGKLKTVITQRFDFPALDGEGTVEVDVECQNRFVFFVVKTETGEWKCEYYKVFYEKDKAIPVDPRRIPKIDDEKLAPLPYGYRYLAYAQQYIAGHKVKMDLPQARGEEFDLMYDAFQLWIDEAPAAEVEKVLGIVRK